MGLSIEFGLICRDAGKVFIRATSNVIPEGYELKIESQIAGTKRTCLLFLDEAKEGGNDKISWIVVAPQYVKQNLVFSLVDFNQLLRLSSVALLIQIIFLYFLYIK